MSNLALAVLFIGLFAIILIIAVCMWWSILHTDTEMRVIHVHNGKIISKEEAELYQLAYIEALEGLIIKYYILKPIIKSSQDFS